MHSEAFGGEDMPLLERTAEVVKDTVPGHIDRFPRRLKNNLSRMTRADYLASHFYTVAVALTRLPDAEADALLAFLEDVREAAREDAGPATIEAAWEELAVVDGAEDQVRMRVAVRRWSPGDLREFLAMNRAQDRAGDRARRVVMRELARRGGRMAPQGTGRAAITRSA